MILFHPVVQHLFSSCEFRWSWKYQGTRGFVSVHSWCARLLPWRCDCHHIQQPDWSSCRKVGPGWFSDEHFHTQVPASWGCWPYLSDIITGRWRDPNSQGTTTPSQTWACTDLPHWDQDLRGDPLSHHETSHLSLFLCRATSFISYLHLNHSTLKSWRCAI